MLKYVLASSAINKTTTIDSTRSIMFVVVGFCLIHSGMVSSISMSYVAVL
jgi:Na+-transporting NADH:ubiquinone oxidoreductase subunit NqrC